MTGGSPHTTDPDLTIHVGDALDVLRTLEDGSVDAVVTSPPYLDARPEYAGPRRDEYDLLFGELARVVAGGMLWNVGRIWRGGIEQLWWTDLIRSAALSGWEHWDTAVWVKPNANPIHGRILANSHEYVLVFGRGGTRFNEDALRTEYAPSSVPRLQRKWINGRGVKADDRDTQHGRKVNEAGARARSFIVCHVGREKGNPHPAPMALDLAEDLVGLASWPGQTILDPFAGSGTTGLAARRLNRLAVLVELNPAYADLAADRLSQLSLLAGGEAA